MSNNTFTTVSIDTLDTINGGQTGLENYTLGEIANGIRGAGCLDAVFQRGMQYGQAGWKADNRLIQSPELPGQVGVVKRLGEAVPACERGGGF